MKIQDKKISLRLDDKTAKALDRISKKKRIHKSALIRQMIQRQIKIEYESDQAAKAEIVKKEA